MTTLRDDIIRMSQETGLCRLIRPQRHEDMLDMLTHFATLVAAAERERIIAQNAPEIETINAHIKALEDALAEPVQESNFCPRCGKRTNDIHTCTPPTPLTDEVIADLWHQNGGFHHHFARAVERWLKGNP